MVNIIGGYFLPMNTAHELAQCLRIQGLDEHQIERSFNNWLSEHGHDHKAAVIQWPRYPDPWGPLGIMFVSSCVRDVERPAAGGGKLDEMEGDLEVKRWLQESGVKELQWVSFKDNLSISMGGIKPRKSDIKSRVTDNWKDFLLH
ncbi:hypothetical protein PILCRDRAFT_819383 [Piloderma croceum F 1598]|uniref:Uncharacterized protein n=1 Tax=Piloderma croceum (strain F 1598) TaxID=765440 RepID=A0A0C3FZT6_PILCF|nr:hypothetical protein PILCRDRAFT_819383 [Piloderma croceum F 1598]